MSEVKAGEQCPAVSSDGHRCELLAIGDLGHTWHEVHFSAGTYWTDDAAEDAGELELVTDGEVERDLGEGSDR